MNHEHPTNDFLVLVLYVLIGAVTVALVDTTSFGTAVKGGIVLGVSAIYFIGAIVIGTMGG